MNTLNQQARRGNKSAATPPAAPATPPAAPAAAAQTQPVEGDKSLTIEEIQTMVGKAVTDSFNAQAPKDAQVTLNDIKGLIASEFEKFKNDSKAVTKDNLNDLVAGVVQAQFDKNRRPKHQINNPADTNGTPGTGDDGQPDTKALRGPAATLDIEMPVSWTKGNLPLHGKQLLNCLMRKNMNEGIDQAMLTKGIALGERVLSGYSAYARTLENNRKTPGMKALTSTGSGTGDEFVPTDLSSELQRRLFLGSNLAAVLSAREIPMPTDPYGLPLSTTRPSFYLESTENTAATASNAGTAKPTLQTIRLVGETDFSYELDEDSIIPILPMLQTLLAEGAADAWEHALINGDDTATHQDTDEELLTKSPAFGFKGFRKLALAISGLKTDLSSGGVGTNANLLAVRKLLKKYGGDPRNLIWLASPTSAIAMQGIAEAVSIDKFGSRATIITGEVAALQGIPIIQSERVREDVDATGVNGASGNTKATVMCINLTRFLTGRRREFMIETDKNIQAGTNIVVASLRKAFIPVETPSASITSVSIGYNFTP